MKIRVVKKPNYLSSNRTAFSIQTKKWYLPFWIEYTVVNYEAAAMDIAKALESPLLWEGERK